MDPQIQRSLDRDQELKPDSLAHLRSAIGAITKDEAKEMMESTILEFNPLNRIELKKDDKMIELENTPRHFLFPEILQAVNASVPVALIGPAGAGKSTAMEQISKALSLPFYLQNGVTGDHQLTGYLDAHGRYHTTPFRTGFEQGGLVFVDEADTSDPSAFKWINTAIANGYAMFPDATEPIRRHEDFRIVIGANTFGNGADRLYVGANQLDASTLDRFVFFDFRYDEKLELLLAGRADWVKRVQRLRKAATEEKARIVISPRASIMGAKMLGLGWKQDIVEQRVIWKGLDPELKDRILKKAA